MSEWLSTEFGHRQSNVFTIIDDIVNHWDQGVFLWGNKNDRNVWCLLTQCQPDGVASRREKSSACTADDGISRGNAGEADGFENSVRPPEEKTGGKTRRAVNWQLQTTG